MYDAAVAIYSKSSGYSTEDSIAAYARALINTWAKALGIKHVQDQTNVNI